MANATRCAPRPVRGKVPGQLRGLRVHESPACRQAAASPRRRARAAAAAEIPGFRTRGCCWGQALRHPVEGGESVPARRDSAVLLEVRRHWAADVAAARTGRVRRRMAPQAPVRSAPDTRCSRSTNAVTATAPDGQRISPERRSLRTAPARSSISGSGQSRSWVNRWGPTPPCSSRPEILTSYTVSSSSKDHPAAHTPSIPIRQKHAESASG
jgi:hypothetical protein